MSIKVTVGKIPGRAQEVTLESTLTIAEALRLANISVDSQSELRVNNVKEGNFNAELSNGDIVSVVKNVKGNADIFTISINQKTDKKLSSSQAMVEVGTFISALMGILELKGSFSDYKWIVNDNECSDPMYKLKLTDTIVEVATPVVESAKKVTKTKKSPVAEPAKKVTKTKKSPVVEPCTEDDTISVTVSINGGKNQTVKVPKAAKGARYGALFAALKLPGKFADYTWKANGKNVSYGFLTIKTDGFVEISGGPSSLVTASDAEPVEKVAKTKKSATPVAEPCTEDIKPKETEKAQLETPKKRVTRKSKIIASADVVEDSQKEQDVIAPNNENGCDECDNADCACEKTGILTKDGHFSINTYRELCEHTVAKYISFIDNAKSIEDVSAMSGILGNIASMGLSIERAIKDSRE